MKKLKLDRRKLDIYSIVLAVLISGSLFGYNYYKATIVKTCYKEQVDLLDKYTVDFQKLTVKDYRVDAQQKLIKQQDEIKKLDKASINEQITICKTYKE